VDKQFAAFYVYAQRRRRILVNGKQVEIVSHHY
jgi:hypothetical protein